MGAEQWVVKVLRDGYRPLVAALQAQATALLDKQAIEVAPTTPSYFYRLFLAPKRGGEWRPVLDRSPLCQFITGLTAPLFHMETAQSFMATMKFGHWSTFGPVDASCMGP